MKSTNPKDVVGAEKVPLSMIPATAASFIALALQDGVKKYGKANWRIEGASAQVYMDACRRHLDAWYDGGEMVAEDSGVHHLGHAAACLCVLLDVQVCGCLMDDRPTPSAPVSGLHKAVETKSKEGRQEIG